MAKCKCIFNYKDEINVIPIYSDDITEITGSIGAPVYTHQALDNSSYYLTSLRRDGLIGHLILHKNDIELIKRHHDYAKAQNVKVTIPSSSFIVLNLVHDPEAVIKDNTDVDWYSGLQKADSWASTTIVCDRDSVALCVQYSQYRRADNLTFEWELFEPYDRPDITTD